MFCFDFTNAKLQPHDSAENGADNEKLGLFKVFPIFRRRFPEVFLEQSGKISVVLVAK